MKSIQEKQPTRFVEYPKLCDRSTGMGRDTFRNILRGAISIENLSYLAYRAMTGGK